jgi:chemotaxis protein CheZ
MSLFEDTVVDVKEADASGQVEVVRTVQTMAGEMQIKETHDAREYFEKKGIDANDPRYMIIDDVVAFLDAIGSHEYDKADDAIQSIMKKGQGDLFKEVGKVTRKLHDSIRNFKEALDPKLKGLATTDMPNAVDQLHHVIERTEEAANKTMAIVEKHILVMDELGAHIKKLSGPEDSMQYLKAYKNGLEDDLTDILTTQSFQDLTGQTIKKVIKLVAELEDELVRLISTFGMKVEPGGVSDEAQSEQVSQAGVDDLLKEFGF